MYTKSPSKIWRMQKYRYRLHGTHCEKCGSRYYPHKSICNKCHTDRYIKDFEFGPFGKVVSWSSICVAPSGFEKYTPYLIALIKLDDGPVVLSQLCDCDESEMKKGLKVRAVLRKLIHPDEADVIKYGLKFEPIR
jgi:uncharacterized OB-fold protein